MVISREDLTPLKTTLRNREDNNGRYDVKNLFCVVQYISRYSRSYGWWSIGSEKVHELRMKSESEEWPFAGLKEKGTMFTRTLGFAFVRLESEIDASLTSPPSILISPSFENFWGHCFRIKKALSYRNNTKRLSLTLKSCMRLVCQKFGNYRRFPEKLPEPPILCGGCRPVLADRSRKIRKFATDHLSNE